MMTKNSTEEATTFILQSRPSPHQSPASYIVKNAPIDDISTTNVHNTFVTTVIDELQDTKCLIVQIDIEASDFKHSGGYCYKLFSFFNMRLPYPLLLFFIYNLHAFSTRLTCLLYMFTSFLHHVLHVFASRQTPVFDLFKPVVRHLYSLAIH